MDWMPCLAAGHSSEEEEEDCTPGPLGEKLIHASFLFWTNTCGEALVEIGPLQ
jgi:hypothetical protein